ncbi:MAG TPA: DUF4097 family beta strand repeat-containing protein [Myxococcota bacterium]|jgi:hypothetical protein|nr:DUF4097 family beta strand repeat-containing protein [Myxococcota bacterium]
MRRANRHERQHFSAPHGGIGGFLRSLLAGIPWSESAERTDVSSVKAPPGGTLRIHNSNGKTRVLGEERDDVSVTACKRARAESGEAAHGLLDEIRVLESGTPGVLELEVVIPRKWNRHGSANLDVRVPKGLRVEVVASNGKVCLAGLRGSVKAKSSNGSVTVSDVVGDVEVTTSNAKVECHDTCGRLVARSSNGKIEVEDHRGSIDASTSNGLIQASVEEVGRDGVLLATSNGRIVLVLPHVVDADVDLHVDNGMIRNDRSLDRAVRETNGRVRGVLGKGGPPVKLRTSNGSICLR